MIPVPALGRYATIVFDCDGVLLDSNRIKTDAFHEVALIHGEEAAERLVEYHRQNGGVSRNLKFQYFLKEILGREPEEGELDTLIAAYANVVRGALLVCDASPALTMLREQTRDAAWMIVSGGAEGELRDVFAQRGMATLFDAGIFGSPTSKDVVLDRELASGRLLKPALFVGDSRYDHEVASNAGLDFVFVHSWTEFSGWGPYCELHGVPYVESLADLLTH